MRISRDECKKKNWNIDWLKLDSLVDEDAEVPAGALGKSSDVVVELERQREKQLNEELGPPWLRLSDRFRRMLCHAEAEFERIAPHLGKHEREYKGNVIDFCAPFEIELDKRLKNLFHDQEMQKFLTKEWRGYKKPEKVSLGHYLQLLKLFHKMSDELKNQVRRQAGQLTAAENKDLLDELSGKLKGFRNNGGHSDPTPARFLVETRELIFAKGLLKRFAAALPAHEVE